jgi:hypothetical protein
LKQSESFNESGRVLLDTVLHYFRAVTDAPEMPIDSLHKRIAAVSQLLADRAD